MRIFNFTVGVICLLVLAGSCKNTNKSSLYDEESSAKSGLASGVTFQTEDKRSAEYVEFANKIRAVKSAGEIDKLLAELDQRYEKNELKTAEVKYFAAQMIPFRNFRSIVYKAKPLFQKDYDASGRTPATNGTHHVAVSAVMAAVAGQRVMLPYTNAAAVEAYITQPNTLNPRYDHTGKGRDSQVVEQYINTDTLQGDLICTQLKADVKKAYERIAALDFGEGSVTVDFGLAFGTLKNTFANPKHTRDRYATIGEAERVSTLSGFMSAMHNIHASCAYSAKDITYAIEALGWTAGLDGAINRTEVSGSTAAVRLRLLKQGILPGSIKSHVATRLALRSRKDRAVSQRIMNPGKIRPNGKAEMHKAVGYSKAAIHYGYLSYLLAKPQSGRGATNEMYPVLDWGRAKPFDRLINMNVEKLMEVAGINPSAVKVSDKSMNPDELAARYTEITKKTGAKRLVAFKSLVTNEPTRVAVDLFYLEPPGDGRAFLPNSYAENPATQFRRVVGGKSMALGSGRSRSNGNGAASTGQTRNFAWGMATQWDTSGNAWGKYFPDINKANHGVRGEIKILAESLGGAPIAAAMAPFVF